MERETLIAIVSALVSGATAGAVTSFVVTKEMLKNPETAKYAKTIQLQQKVIALNEKIKIERAKTLTRTDRYRKLEDQINVAATKLMRFVLDNFGDPNTEHQFTLEEHFQVRDLFDRWLVVDTLTVDGLKSLLDNIVPIAVFRRIIGTERARLETCHPAFGPAITEFAMRYKNVILGDPDINVQRQRNAALHEYRMIKYPEYAEHQRRYKHPLVVRSYSDKVA